MSIDKTATILPFLIPHLHEHVSRTESSPRPLICGINGLQGSGKSYLVDQLVTSLKSPPRNLNVVAFSIDDFYHPFSILEELRKSHPDNKLLAQRGEPGTHDVALASKVLKEILQGEETKVPFFDKSLHAGKGDRVPGESWTPVHPPVDIVLFEGWCAGFRSISKGDVEEKWKESRDADVGELKSHSLEDLLWINTALKSYDQLTDQFDIFIHLDAEKLQYVFDWRLEQEHNLIIQKGSGMMDDQVIQFINGYIPGYELYLDNVRKGVIAKGDDAEFMSQLRIVMGQDREVLGAELT